MSAIAGNTSVRPFSTLAGAVVLLGIGDSMAGSYLVLFASEHAGLTPVQVGVFSSAPAAGGIVLGALAGRRFDRAPTKAYAIAAALLGALGFLLLTTTTSAPLLILIGVTLIAAGQAAFAQLFTLARVVLGDGRAGRRSAPLLRSGWSLAWALGPLAGAALLPRAGFPGLLTVAAAVVALAALSAAAAPTPRTPVAAPSPSAVTASRPSRPALALLVGGVTLFFLAMFAGSVALPLYVTRELHEPAGAVGLMFSACSAVEVVVALVLAGLPQRLNQRALIAGAMVAMAAFFAITVLASGMTTILLGQIARGVAIAVVGAAGIRFFQDLLAPATGRATTLFANAGAAGSLLSGVLAGLAITHWGYTTTLALCGVSALAGAAMFAVSPRAPSTRSSRPPLAG